MFFGVPTMWARLAASPRLPELAALRLLVSGSAPLPPDLFEAVRSATGQAPLERYGMSETVMLAANPLRGERRAGTVGRPLPGVEIRLGRRRRRGGARAQRLRRLLGQRRTATAAAFTADGWFRTGDLGEWDEDGYLRLVGRASELIITGGYNVYPREVEDALRTHPAVDDVAVVGAPDPEWGEVVVAYVVEREPVSDEALAAHLADRVAPYKRPRRWRAGAANCPATRWARSCAPTCVRHEASGRLRGARTRAVARSPLGRAARPSPGRGSRPTARGETSSACARSAVAWPTSSRGRTSRRGRHGRTGPSRGGIAARGPSDLEGERPGCATS